MRSCILEGQISRGTYRVNGSGFRSMDVQRLERKFINEMVIRVNRVMKKAFGVLAFIGWGHVAVVQSIGQPSTLCTVLVTIR